MNFSYENQGSHTYLVYTMEANETIDTMSLGMLTNNHIPGLAPALYTQMDSMRYIKYDVSAKISLKQYFSGPINKNRLVGVFSGISNAIITAEDYMIDINSILFDLDYIFVDVSTNETELVCLPTIEKSIDNFDVGAFFKNIVFSSQFDQSENCDYVTKIINHLNGSTKFSVYEFKKMLDDVAANASTIVPKPQATVPVTKTETVQPNVPKKVEEKPADKPQTPPPAKQEVKQNVVSQPVQSIPTPVVPTPVVPTPVTPAPAEPAPKKMSMLNLLMHYNKENAAAYKAQKEASKNGATVPTPPQPQKAMGTPNAGFAVPGQPTPPPAPKANFAVPGQPTPPPAPKANFAVPGQQVAPPSPPKQEPQKPVISSPTAQAKAPVAQPVNTPPVNQNFGMNFGETTVLGGGNMGETTVLGATTATVQDDPHLIRVKNNEKIKLNKPVFRIGKEKSYVDYFIGDNTAISRSHANFISRDGEYFVTDTNSTNHTYVNGVMIQSNVETKLSHGDKVRLANEDFEFKVY